MHRSDRRTWKYPWSIRESSGATRGNIWRSGTASQARYPDHFQQVPATEPANFSEVKPNSIESAGPAISALSKPNISISLRAPWGTSRDVASLVNKPLRQGGQHVAAEGQAGSSRCQGRKPAGLPVSIDVAPFDDGQTVAREGRAHTVMRKIRPMLVGADNRTREDENLTGMFRRHFPEKCLLLFRRQ